MVHITRVFASTLLCTLLVILIVGAGSITPAPATACSFFEPPVDGPVVAGFEPRGRYAGHWGLDFATTSGESVRAAGDGIVTWSGVVVGNVSVTVHHGGGLRTSYSYLQATAVSQGDVVVLGQVIGEAASPHVHFSLRIGDGYRDPTILFRCMGRDLSGGLQLVRVSYPAAGATRHPRRDVRPTSHRPPVGRGDRVSPIGPRRSAIHPGGSALAEVRSRRF